MADQVDRSSTWLQGAFIGGMLVGFLHARIVDGEAEILNIGVVRAYRRRGIASALIAALIKELPDGATARVFLEVADSNVAAQALYCHCGFRAVAVRPNYYRDSGGAAVQMVFSDQKTLDCQVAAR